jgi:hypothetical protein
VSRALYPLPFLAGQTLLIPVALALPDQDWLWWALSAGLLAAQAYMSIVGLMVER